MRGNTEFDQSSMSQELKITTARVVNGHEILLFYSGNSSRRRTRIRERTNIGLSKRVNKVSVFLENGRMKISTGNRRGKRVSRKWWKLRGTTRRRESGLDEIGDLMSVDDAIKSRLRIRRREGKNVFTDEIDASVGSKVESVTRVFDVDRMKKEDTFPSVTTTTMSRLERSRIDKIVETRSRRHEAFFAFGINLLTGKVVSVEESARRVVGKIQNGRSMRRGSKVDPVKVLGNGISGMNRINAFE